MTAPGDVAACCQQYALHGLQGNVGHDGCRSRAHPEASSLQHVSLPVSAHSKAWGQSGDLDARPLPGLSSVCPCGVRAPTRTRDAPLGPVIPVFCVASQTGTCLRGGWPMTGHQTNCRNGGCRARRLRPRSSQRTPAIASGSGEYSCGWNADVLRRGGGLACMGRQERVFSDLLATTS